MFEVKVGFLGFGNVGTGAYRIIRDNGSSITKSEGINLKVEKILVRNSKKKREVEIDQSLITDNIDDIINNPDISIVAEFMGGVEPAKQYILSCLKNKRRLLQLIRS